MADGVGADGKEEQAHLVAATSAVVVDEGRDCSGLEARCAWRRNDDAAGRKEVETPTERTRAKEGRGSKEWRSGSPRGNGRTMADTADVRNTPRDGDDGRAMLRRCRDEEEVIDPKAQVSDAKTKAQVEADGRLRTVELTQTVLVVVDRGDVQAKVRQVLDGIRSLCRTDKERHHRGSALHGPVLRLLDLHRQVHGAEAVPKAQMNTCADDVQRRTVAFRLRASFALRKERETDGGGAGGELRCILSVPLPTPWLLRFHGVEGGEVDARAL